MQSVSVEHHKKYSNINDIAIAEIVASELGVLVTRVRTMPSSAEDTPSQRKIAGAQSGAIDSGRWRYKSREHVIRSAYS